MGEVVNYNHAKPGFRVLHDGVPVGSFSKCDDPYKVTIETAEQRTGTSSELVAHSVTSVKREPVKLSGAFAPTNLEFWSTWNDECTGEAGVGTAIPEVYQKTIVVEGLAEDRTTVVSRYTYSNCILTEYEEDGFEAESNEFRMLNVAFMYTGKPKREVFK